VHKWKQHLVFIVLNGNERIIHTEYRYCYTFFKSFILKWWSEKKRFFKTKQLIQIYFAAEEETEEEKVEREPQWEVILIVDKLTAQLLFMVCLYVHINWFRRPAVHYEIELIEIWFMAGLLGWYGWGLMYIIWHN